MKKLQWKSPKYLLLIAVIALAIAVFAACSPKESIIKVPATEEYTFSNPEPNKAEADAGMKIDGVLDEAVYSEKKWLHLAQNEGGNAVTIDVTSHFGEAGMYFAFDVTESFPIYVNPDRASTLNSGIELYLGAPHVQNVKDTAFFEIDLLPTGDMRFKKSDGKYGYINVATTNDIMACLGATTKGGEVNTTDCNGYVLELYIPWEYMERLGLDAAAMKDNFVLINVAHITSYNYAGTNHDLDRYWYYYVQEIGTDFTNVAKYFRFDGQGIMGTTEIALEKGEHYSFQGSAEGFPGMQVPITIIPDAGYALTSILLNGQEQIRNAVFNEDGSATLMIRCTSEQQKLSAVTEAVTDGKKTLSGKLYLNSLPGGTMDGVFVSYVGPLGEKPVVIDSEGNFRLEALDPGYYVLKIEKDGFTPTTYGVYLNRDAYVELVFKSPVFTVTKGNCWILDDENKGVLHKLSGNGDVLSKAAYHDFTLETYLKYDTELAKQSNADEYLQQRSGVRIIFSNGKGWHIDLLRENDYYILQYARHSGDNSLFNWKKVHTLSAEQEAKYFSKDGIKLTIKRVGNKAAVCLDDKVLFIEELAAEYADLTAQLGLEAWISNPQVMDFPYSISASAKLPEAPKVYFYPANTWDVTNQNDGYIHKTGVAGVTTWLDSAIIGNDITTTARDLSPSTNDYSMIYIFKFSNGEQFRVRLNHTDNDGKYRIQSMANSTLFDAWKNHYTLTDEQAQKVQAGGIQYRVLISGTTAYVYLDGQQVCTYDLSKVVATGKPSGIEKATVSVHLRLDGNIGKTFAIPFKLVQNDKPVEPEKPTEPEKPVEPENPVDPSKRVTLNIGSFANGTVTPGKTAYAVGETVKLTITPNAGYFQKLYINGKPLMLDWKTFTYEFVATEKTYNITGSFERGLNLAPSDWARWDDHNQLHGVLNAYYPNNADSWYMDIKGDYQSIAVNAKNFMSMAESAESSTNSHGFSVVLRITMDNGNVYAFRILNKQQSDGTALYEYTRFGSGGSVTGWGGWTQVQTKDAAATDLLNGDGAVFKLERTGANVLTLTINGSVLDTYTMDGITAANKVVSVGMMHQGNQGKYAEIPFEVVAAN